MRGAAAMQKGSESTSDLEERSARSGRASPWLEGTFLGDPSGLRIPLSRRISESARLMRQRCARSVVLWGGEQQAVAPRKLTRSRLSVKNSSLVWYGTRVHLVKPSFSKQFARRWDLGRASCKRPSFYRKGYFQYVPTILSVGVLAEGIEHALWQLGGVPQQHRTDHLTAAVRQTHRKETRQEWTARYQAPMAHYGMQPTWNNVGLAHENGDVEQAHHRFKQALDQALRVRGSREFARRAAYWHFVCDLVARRHRSRAARWHEEQAALRRPPRLPLLPCKEVQVQVSRLSTIHVGSNVYSVPSRLIGTKLLVRLPAETVEGSVGTKLAFTLPPLVGTHQHRIDYHHFIWSLVRKPGACAAYRSRDDLFPTMTFRLAYDRLCQDVAGRADGQYVRLLHLAASTSEAEVDTALQVLLEARQTPTAEAVRELVQRPGASFLPELSPAVLTLEAYDQLTPSRRDHA